MRSRLWTLWTVSLALLGSLACSEHTATAEVIPIGTIQGAVAEGSDAANFKSPMDGQTVEIQGVIYARSIYKNNRGTAYQGFFIQNTAATADGDPETSDGIYVFMHTNPGIVGGYKPVIGDEVVLRGEVTEYHECTQFSKAKLIEKIRSDVDLDSELPDFEPMPPSDAKAAAVYWERHEGMRATVPAGSRVLSGRHVWSSSADAEFAMLPASALPGGDADPYAVRAFRSTHPLGNQSLPALRLGSHCIKGTFDDPEALIDPAVTFQELAAAISGPVHYAYSKYIIHPTTQPELIQSIDPSKNAPPQTADRAQEFSIATFNVENLYDMINDPFDDNDFTGDPGAGGIRPPFNYVPASDAAYKARVKMLARQIVEDLHSPDLILIQEAEDQDLASFKQDGDLTTLIYGEENNADGQCDDMQELIMAIAAVGGPHYETAYDRDGADIRGIVCGFLYRPDRLELAYPNPGDPILSETPTVEYPGAAHDYNSELQNPKAMNATMPDGSQEVYARSAQVGAFLLWPEGVGTGEPVELYAIVNHFASRPNQRIERRRQQAAYGAALIKAIETASPEALIVYGGDLNVYPRPDDPFEPGDREYPSDQLAALYEVGLLNLYDKLLEEVPASAYSYVYDGRAQTLDHLFVNDDLAGRYVQVRAAHINSDWSPEAAGDAARAASDHDPVVARFGL